MRRGLVDLSQPSAEPFRGLRLALELRGERRRGNIVVFTSANPEEGKSTIASNYALVASVSQQRVLLIDADLRHPVLHETFGLTRAPGLVELLGDTIDFAQAARRVPSPGHLEVVTAGHDVVGVGDLMNSKRMHEFLDLATTRSDVVVLDTPPVLRVPDAEMLASRDDVDVVLVVDRRAKRRTLSRAVRELELVGANVVGLVVNREGALSRYGYG